MICSSLNRDLFSLSVSFIATNSTSKWRKKRVSGHDYREDLAALDALLASGQVTLDQYRAACRDLRIAFLDAQTTLAAGVERGFLKVVRDIEDAAQTMEDLQTATFKGAEDALVSWVRTGKLDFGNMVESLTADLTRLLIQRQVAAPLLFALGSALGIGFATGGSFTVPDAPRVPVPAQPERQATVRSEAATGSAPMKSQKTTVNVYGADDAAEVVESEGPNGLKIIDVYVDGRTPRSPSGPIPDTDPETDRPEGGAPRDRKRLALWAASDGSGATFSGWCQEDSAR